MAFGNYAPMGGYYQPPQQNFYVSANPNPVPDMLSQFKAQYQPQANFNNFIKIHNEKEVGDYPVAPGNTIVLWAEKEPYFYMKSADFSGSQIIKVYEYKEREITEETTKEHVCQCGKKFVSKEDFEILQNKIERLTNKIDALSKSEIITAKQKGENNE
jgi:hypothetical protein